MKLNWYINYELQWLLKHMELNSSCQVSSKILNIILDKSQNEDGITSILPELFNTIDFLEKNAVVSRYVLGICYLNGLSVKRDEKKAVSLFRFATDRGYAPAERYLAFCYEVGLGVEKNRDQAYIYYQGAAQKGYAPAQDNLGQFYEDPSVGSHYGSREETLALAVKCYELAALQGYAPSQMRFGDCLQNGRGIDWDDKRAAEFFELAAHQGMPDAQRKLSECYDHGAGTVENNARAVLLREAALAQGHCSGTQLIKLFVPKLNNALDYYQKRLSSNKEDLEALSTLAFCYQMGLGTEIDLKKAIELYSQAIALNKNSDWMWDLYACYRHQYEMHSRDEVDSIDFKRLLEFYGRLTELVNQGHERHALQLAYLYENGAPGLIASVLQSFNYYSISEKFYPFSGYVRLKISRYSKKALFFQKIADQTTSEACLDDHYTENNWEELSRLLSKNKSITDLDVVFLRPIPEKCKSYSADLNCSLHVKTICSKGDAIANVRHFSDTLAHNQNILMLNLSCNRLRDIGIHIISGTLMKNKNITTLNLHDNRIGTAGAESLGELLKQNQTISTLILKENFVDEFGAGYIASGLAQNRSLTSLNLEDNRIGDLGLSQLANALFCNQSLTVLNLRRNAIRGAQAKVLKEALILNTGLLSLYLSNNKIDAEGCEVISEGLAQNKALTELRIDDNKVNDLGAKALGQALTKNRTIKLLELDANEITSEGAKGISEGLAANQSLTSLGLGQNNIGNLGAEWLSNALTHNRTLMVLELPFNQIKDQGIRALGNALTYNRGLTSLDLHANEIRDTGICSLSEGLVRNRKLKILNLGYNRIEDQGFRALLRANQNLNSLNLENNMSFIDLQDVCDLLAQNQTLTELNLVCTSIRVNEKIPLQLKNFEKNRSLTAFKLSTNSSLQRDTLDKIKKILDRNSPDKLKERMSLVMGFHARLGADTALQKACRDPLFDRKLISLIFQYSGSASNSFVDGHQDSAGSVFQEAMESKDSKSNSNQPTF